MIRALLCLCACAAIVSACGNTTPPAALTPAGAPAMSQAPSRPTATVAAIVSNDPAAASVAWPACALPVERPIDLPANFAPNFRFPAGAKLLKASTLRNDAHTQLQIVGIVPLSLQDSTQFLKHELAKAGYVIANTDQESNESDGLFKGNGWTGSYRVNTIDDCPEATTWSVRALKL